tara:strand:- start:2064 stop:2291 length:228 start_codon:yes stop_codon:yes gene_type:complete
MITSHTLWLENYSKASTWTEEKYQKRKMENQEAKKKGSYKLQDVLDEETGLLEAGEEWVQMGHGYYAKAVRKKDG